MNAAVAGEGTVLRVRSIGSSRLPARIMHALACPGEPHHHLDRRVGIPLGRALRPWRLHRPGRILSKNVHRTDVRGQRRPSCRHCGIDDGRPVVEGGQPLILERDDDQAVGAIMEQPLMDELAVALDAGDSEHDLRTVL